MIIRKVLRTTASAALIGAAVLVSVVSAGFAVYAVLAPFVGVPGAAAIVAAIFAVLALIAGLVLADRAEDGGKHHHHHHAPAPDASFIERIIDLAKDKPILSTAAALGAGVFFMRNPVLFAALAKAFMETRAPDRD
ncbi:hypothetical protein P7B02_08675 [Caulobacter segnis]|uniref:hypothetical protein n=1 Tax=Caulobacter segnis TaxID=88688 RepID=UPI0024104546|nr:hypothetical protein [Caulobacter segnis]MDG2521615.1 hypothetical protein [Caulobacter segnis]